MFRFFVGGEWRDLVVDDRLPTYNGKLLFLKSADPTEFWPALIEKAFAKLNGSYHVLNGGTFGEASSYFGAMTENFNIRGPQLGGLDPVFVKGRLEEAGRRGSLCGAAIYDLGKYNHDSYSRWGLPSGHAYSITGFSEDKVRVRNPWGGNTEWVEQTSEADGEFWIEWADFMVHFHQVQIAHYSSDAAAGLDQDPGRKWTSLEVRGSWDRSCAGGCPNFASYYMNPQYEITVGAQDGASALLLVSLDQLAHHRQEMAREQHAKGFIIHRSSTPGHRLSRRELLAVPWVADSGVYRYGTPVIYKLYLTLYN